MGHGGSSPVAPQDRSVCGGSTVSPNQRYSEGRYCLNDLHKAAGGSKTHQLSNWARRTETDELVNALLQDSNLRLAPLAVTHGGPNRGTNVCEDLVIDYAAWISPQFRLKVYRVFKQAAMGQVQQPVAVGGNAMMLQQLEVMHSNPYVEAHYATAGDSPTPMVAGYCW